ncbi:MAG: hypothetical protein IPP40_10640 [bacterium]|nr:hypothetical protein [bacterium]
MSLRQLVLHLALACGAVVGWAANVGNPSSHNTPLPSVPSKFAGPEVVQAAEVNVLSNNLSNVSLSFVIPAVSVVETELSGQVYSSVVMSGEAGQEIPGAPDLPRIVRLVMVDNTGNYDLHVNDLQFTTSTLPHLPSPYVPLAEGANALDDSEVSLDPEYYNNNSWYPQEVVTISEPATLRDVRFVLVTISPVQVNPVTGEIRAYSQVDVSLTQTSGIGANEITHNPEFISPAFKALYRTMPNFEGSRLDALPELPGSHLYICDPNASVVAAVQNLVNWRRKRGINAYIATTTQTGTTATSIRNYIVNEFSTSNGALEYVTLVGDPDAVAPYQIATGTALDNSYATMTGETLIQYPIWQWAESLRQPLVI